MKKKNAVLPFLSASDMSDTGIFHVILSKKVMEEFKAICKMNGLNPHQVINDFCSQYHGH